MTNNNPHQQQRPSINHNSPAFRGISSSSSSAAAAAPTTAANIISGQTRNVALAVGGGDPIARHQAASAAEERRRNHIPAASRDEDEAEGEGEGGVRHKKVLSADPDKGSLTSMQSSSSSVLAGEDISNPHLYDSNGQKKLGKSIKSLALAGIQGPLHRAGIPGNNKGKNKSNYGRGQKRRESQTKSKRTLTMNDLKSSRENRGSSNQSSVNGDDDDGVGGCGNCGNYLEDDDVQIVENIEAEDAFGENNAFQDTQKNKSNKTDSNRKRSSSDAEACGGEGGMKPESFKHAGPAGKWKQQQQHKPNDHQKNDPIVVDDDDDGDVSDELTTKGGPNIKSALNRGCNDSLSNGTRTTGENSAYFAAPVLDQLDLEELSHRTTKSSPPEKEYNVSLQMRSYRNISFITRQGVKNVDTIDPTEFKIKYWSDVSCSYLYFLKNAKESVLCKIPTTKQKFDAFIQQHFMQYAPSPISTVQYLEGCLVDHAMHRSAVPSKKLQSRPASQSEVPMHQPKRPLSQTFYGVNQSASAAYSILHPDGGVNPTDFYASTVGSNAKGKKKDSELDDYHHPRNYSLFGDSEYHSQLQGLWKGRPTRNSSGTRDDADLTRAIELSKTERTRRSVRAEVHDHTQRTTLSGKIFDYPPTSKFPVTINWEDYNCLYKGEFLNDTIIEYYIRYMFDHQYNSEQIKEDFHVYNTFFYTQLTRKDDAYDTPYDSVKKWTNKIDIFKKKFLIVPINEHLHWYLAIIYNPGALLFEQTEVIDVDDDPMDLDLDDKDILNTSLDRKGFSSRQTRAKSAAAASAVSDEILVVSDHQPPSPMSKVHKDRQMNAKDYEETDEELDNAFAISKKMGDQSLMRGSQRGGGGPLEGKHSSTPKRSSKRVGGVASSVKSSISGYGISENDLVVDGEDDDDDVVELTKIDDAGSNVTEPGYVPPSILSTSPSKSSRRVQSIVKNVSSNNNNNYNHNKNARGDSGGESLPLSTFSSNRQLSSPAASSSAFVAHNSKFPLKPGSFAESVASALKDPYPVVINAMMDSYDSEEIFDAVADAAALATLEKSNAARGDELEPVQVDAAVLPEMFEEGHEITDLHRVQTQIMDEIERQKASKREEGCDIDVEGEEEMAPSSDKSTGKRRRESSMSEAGQLTEDDGDDVVVVDDDKPGKYSKKSATPKKSANKKEKIKSEKKLAREKEQIEAGLKKCFIFTLDSLGGGHPTVFKKLDEYLRNEALSKKNFELKTKPIHSQVTKIPRQPNYCDCGLYLLEYIACFLKKPDELTRIMIGKLGEGENEDHWFHRDHVFKLRKTIQEQIEGEYSVIQIDRIENKSGPLLPDLADNIARGYVYSSFDKLSSGSRSTRNSKKNRDEEEDAVEHIVDEQGVIHLD